MARFHVNFDRENALKYQLQMVTKLLEEHGKNLQVMKQDRKALEKVQKLMASKPEAWQPLQDQMKPMPDKEGKRLKFQELLVSYLKAKFSALSLMIANQSSPSVSVGSDD